MPTVLQKKPRMQEHDLYEYAVIRLVPKVEREEFFNIGLVMLCKRKRWLQMEFEINREKFKAFCPELEADFIKENLQAFKNIAEGVCEISPIGQLDAAERFRWLTAVRSSSIQTSRPHVGKTIDLEATFNKLFQELIR